MAAFTGAKNVLMIVVDDLKPLLTYTYGAHVYTPTLIAWRRWELYLFSESTIPRWHCVVPRAAVY